MKVIIVGCGKAGMEIAESLLKEKHEVIMIDTDAKVVANASDNFDALTICGSGTSYEVLQSAGVKNADIFVAVTESDESNMLSCFFAKKLGARHTIARIRDVDYTGEGLEQLTSNLEISMAVNPELMTAQHIFDMLKLPASAKVQTFAGKKFRLLELPVKEDSPLCGQALKDLRKNCGVLFIVCAMLRGDECFVPDGETILQEGDRIGIIVAQGDVGKLSKVVGLSQKQAKDVLIVSASAIAYYLAKLLLANNNSVKVVENDAVQCKEFNEKLPSATVVCGDGTSQDLLEEEGIANVDALVNLTGVDEENVIVSFLAMNYNVPKVIAKINRDEIANIAQKMGLDSVVSPKRIVADVITRYARALQNDPGSKIETLYSIMNGNAEALEFAVSDDFDFVDVPLQSLSVTKGVIIAGIIRGKETIIPTGQDSIKAGDKVVVVSVKKHFADLSDCIRRR